MPIRKTAPTTEPAASTTLHIVTPAQLRDQIETLRDQLETATMIRPTVTDIVRRALELGLSAMSARVSTMAPA